MYYSSYLSAVFYYKYLYANAILKLKQVICFEKLSFAFGVHIVAIFPTGYGESLIYQLLLLKLFGKRAVEERPTQGLCEWVNDVTSVLLVTVYRERAFDKQSSSKIMRDKTQSIINKGFSAAIKMWQRKIAM